MVGPYAVLARDSRGRWLLGTMNRSQGEVAVYNPTGTLLQRFGRKGEGPGELQGIFALLITRGDTVRVFDNYLRRYSVFTPEYGYVRSSSYSGQVFGAAELPDGALIVNAAFPRADAVGYPLHELDGSGRTTRSFGAEVPYYRSFDVGGLSRAMTPAGEGRIWTVERLRYEPKLWTLSGKVSELQRLAPWFPPVYRVQQPGRGQPPSPWVGGAWQDEGGRLWVLLNVPDARWRPPPQEMVPQGERGFPIAWDREYDTILEVINPETGQLLATRRYDELLHMLLPGGYTVHYRETPEGDPFLDIWQVHVVTPTRR